MGESSTRAKATPNETLLENDSLIDASLKNWTEELSAAGIETRAEKHGGSLSTDVEPISGTKDPTKSRKRDVQPGKKDAKALSTDKVASRTTVVTKTKKTVAKPSRPLEKSAPKERRSGSKPPASPGQSSTTDMATLLKEVFSGFAVEMNKGFNNLGELLKAKKDGECANDTSEVNSDSESEDRGSGADLEADEPARKKQKTDDDTVLSKDNSDILDKLEKDFNVSEQDGAEINGNLATIVQKLLKDKPEEDKLNETKKRYLKPKNCDMLAETRVNLPIWNNLSERARTSDLKFQKVQKSLVKGTTAVVGVVNALITKPDVLPKSEIVKQLMDGVLLMANANMELNLRRREALKPELHTSYRYLCAPSNPITTELFGDDLPKVVKDITDTNRITSKLSRDNTGKQSFKRPRHDGRSDRYQNKYRSTYPGPSKNSRRPFFSQKEGGKKSIQKNQN